MNEDLVKRFAPVLFLHPEEKFVPVDAKRYIENANLWSASGKLDDKASWGGSPTAAFPRRPLVAAGGISGVTGETGQVIDSGPLQPQNSSDEMFLEIGGWQDSAAAHEPGVTATSTNVYADRSAIADSYERPELKASRFWYHAELYDGDRLGTLARRAAPPDVSRFITANSALLCYYFFFPAHQQSVGSDQCNDTVSQEAAGHAGDWQCMAILLEGDGSGAAGRYKPQFFGCTGARPAASEPSQARPVQFDDDGLTVMKVERWRPATGPARDLPAVDENTHPRLFVALGTHGLYTVSGQVATDPFRPGQQPQWCGKFDTPSAMPEGYGQSDDDNDLDFGSFAAFFAKLMTGLGTAGAPGAIIGCLAASAEGNLGWGLDVVGSTEDRPDPDKVAAAGAGRTIRPKGVTVAGAGDTVEDWKVQQNLRIGGRRYDYLVDRASQRWWPNDDLEQGFRGRWGQRVTADFLPRRSGPHFPDYLKMFFHALAAGDAEKKFEDV